MGIYVYKVLKESVPLMNGERAHIAMFAYKDGWRIPENTHSKTGCTRCDNAARNGERGQWIVLGFKNDDGTVKLNPFARKAQMPLGSFVETFSAIAQCDIDQSRCPKKFKFYESQSA